eukprot:1963908-Amphidinium_carterae.1
MTNLSLLRTSTARSMRYNKVACTAHLCSTPDSLPCMPPGEDTEDGGLPERAAQQCSSTQGERVNAYSSRSNTWPRDMVIPELARRSSELRCVIDCSIFGPTGKQWQDAVWSIGPQSSTSRPSHHTVRAESIAYLS